MNNTKDNADYEEEIFGSSDSSDNQASNNRIAVRYVRTDIKASLSDLGLFSFSKNIIVKLVDISSKGAAIEYKAKLALKKNITLTVFFEDQTVFTIKAKVVHKCKNQYGLKFNHFNNELGDYLLSSQNDLIFK